jgi:hypothetical protein
MALLQFLNCFFDLGHLIRFCHLSVTLEIDAGITLSRGFENVVAPGYARFSKIVPAEVYQIVE